jgi:F0F1-type ATP synthase epsilon subunit
MPSSNIQPNFELEIVTPKKVATYLISMIEVETSSGSFTVAADHAPLVSSLKKKGIATFQTNVGISHTIHIENGGLFKVANNKALLVLHQQQI